MVRSPRLVTLVPIHNMNRAIKFYTKTLGARMGERAPGAMRDMWASVSLYGSDVWLIAPEKWEKRELAYSMIVVKNIKAAVKRLTANGVRFQRAEKMSEETRIEGPVAYESFGASAVFKDSEGNVLMVWQNFPPM